MSVSPYQQLEREWQRLHAFRGALSLLRWDAAVMMPRGSAAVRGNQLAALETETHALLTSPRISRLLDRAQASASMLGEWELTNLREMRRQRDRAIAMPIALITRLAQTVARAEGQWLEARAQQNFAIFAPHLEEVLNLIRDKAALVGQALNLSPYDALADEFSPGITTADYDSLFHGYGRRLPSLVREAIELQKARPVVPIAGRFNRAQQRALTVDVMQSMGFSFDHGRLDESTHAFTEGFRGDVRVTTRFNPDDCLSGLLGALHEAGHAMYANGLPAEWTEQPVGHDCGMALEESQSLLIEMILVRSRAFVRFLKPLLEKHFGVSGPEWHEENLYRQLTRVRRSPIRVEADELTYPLHVQLRYDLERQLLAGELSVAQLPEAWADQLEQRLGIRPDNAADGALQDIHWALGSFGYFPSYAMGAAIAAQLAEGLRRDLPELDAQISAGDFSGLIAWLGQHVHSFGARLKPQELILAATGKPISASASLRYLEAKYLEQSASSSAAA